MYVQHAVYKMNVAKRMKFKITQIELCVGPRILTSLCACRGRTSTATYAHHYCDVHTQSCVLPVPPNNQTCRNNTKQCRFVCC